MNTPKSSMELIDEEKAKYQASLLRCFRKIFYDAYDGLVHTQHRSLVSHPKAIEVCRIQFGKMVSIMKSVIDTIKDSDNISQKERDVELNAYYSSLIKMRANLSLCRDDHLLLEIIEKEFDFIFTKKKG